MAEAFVKKIEDFLACSICFEQLKDPVGLPCLHGFCFECLHDWHKSSQDKTHVICPACKNTTPLPNDGIRGFPGHFLVNNLRETVHMEKQKVDTSTCSEIQVGDKVILEDTEKEGIVQSIDGKEVEADFSGETWTGKASSLQLVSTDTTSSAPCDLCSKPADSHCLDCKQYLCKQCHKQHDAFKLMRGHKVVAASDVLSGKISSQGRHCPVHGDLIRFYCNSENKQVCYDCITLKSCAIEHDRAPLPEAAKKQLKNLKRFLSALEGKKEAYHSYISRTEKIKENFDISYKKANEDLEKVITETTEKLQELLQKKRVILTEEYSMKDKKVIKMHSELKSKVSSSNKACTLAEDVISHGSDHEITLKYSTLKTTMDGITSSKDQYDISESLGTFSFEPGKPEDYIKLKSYPMVPSECRNIESVNIASDIAIFPNGELAIASDGDGAGIYYIRNGTFTSISSGTIFPRVRTAWVPCIKHLYKRCTLQCAPRKVKAIAVTPDNKIIITGKSKLLCFNRDGTQIRAITTMSSPISVAVDNKGRIIAGLNDKRISIHSSDGAQISYFKTTVLSYYLSATSQNTLVVTLHDDDHTGALKVMAYDGRVNTEIIPPHKSIEWKPRNTCCNSRNEIYVINETGHNYIFWYTHDGKYLGLVTFGIECPKCLTVSSDDDKLIVAQANGTVQFYV